VVSDVIAFAPWTPDVDGVLPGKNGYYPWPALDPSTNALPARPYGAGLVKPGTTYEAFAGTEDALYRFNAGTSGWIDVTGAAPYTATEMDPWQFAVFNDRVIALTSGTLPQTFKPATESNFSTLTNAPQGQALGVWGEHLVIGAGNIIHGSSVNAPTVWAPLETNTAFEQEFASGGEIKGFTNSNNPIIVQERMIRRGSLVGGRERIVFDVAAEGIGTDHPASIARFGSALFMWSNTGFVQVAPDGSLTNIGADKVDKWFLGRADQERRIQGWPDIVGRRVFWAFHDPFGGANFDQIVCYDLATQQWSRASYKISEFAGVAFTSVRLDDIDISIDDIEFSFDDVTQAYAFGGFDRDFKAGTFTGAPLKAKISTAEFPNSGAGRTRLHWAMPQVDADEAKLTVYRRERRGLPLEAVVEGVTVRRTGLCYLRNTGRFFRLILNIPEGFEWTWATGLEVEASGEGLQ
jgi:hypothetical protein